MSGIVSVIIPTYNRAKLVCEAVDSVLAQRCDDVEILVVDDGSTDGTDAALRCYGDRIRYFSQRNQGVSATRNRGLAEARGEYVALLDNDDLWLPSKLAMQTRILDLLPDAGFLFTDFFILKPDGTRIPEGLRSWHSRRHHWSELFEDSQPLTALMPEGAEGLPGHEARVFTGDIYRPSLIEPWVLPSTALIRRRCIDDDLRFVESDPTCGDWEFFARLSRRHGAAFLDLETTLNRSHEDAVRLTRISASLQALRRVEMIERVWKADADFFRERREEVERAQGEALVILAKLSLLDGDSRRARSALHCLADLSTRRSGWQDLALGAVAWLPGSKHAARLSRRMLRLLG